MDHGWVVRVAQILNPSGFTSQMLSFETVLKVVVGAFLAFFAEKAVHWWQQKTRRGLFWGQLRRLGDSISFASSTITLPEGTRVERECDSGIMRDLCVRQSWKNHVKLPHDPIVSQLDDLNSHIFVIGSPKYNKYAKLIQQQFSTQMEFVWDLYPGDPPVPLLKIVTRHGEEYTATQDLHTDIGESAIDYGIFFHAILENGKHVYWLAGIHGPGTIGVYRALCDHPEIFAETSNARPTDAKTWFLRVIYKNDGKRRERDHPGKPYVVPLGVLAAMERPSPGPTPRVLIFDLGNVLMFFDRTRTYRTIGHRLGISWEKICEVIAASNLSTRYELGAFSTEEMRLQICDLLDVDPKQLPTELFAEFWGDLFFANTKMINLIHELEKTGLYTFVLLSNTNELHFNNVSNHFPEVLSPFKHRLVLSYKERCDKSTDDIYHRACAAAGAQPLDCIFIDDKPEHVARANRIGMKGLVYFKYPSFVVKLRELGIYIP